jgi:hypothetical protein
MENVQPEKRSAAEGWLASRSRNASELDPPNNPQVASAPPESHETLPSVEEEVNIAGAIPREGPFPVPLPKVRKGGQEAPKMADQQMMIERREGFCRHESSKGYESCCPAS